MGFFQDPAGATTAFFNDPGSATSGNIVPGLDNPFQSGKTVWLPGAGGLNPLNSDSAVGQLTKDLGALNPYNPDSVAGKVVNNIGKDMAADPAKWVAIAAAVATGQVYLIPYINGAAAVTKKNSSPEEWLTEGAKAYVISAGGEYVANNVTGVGPQTDITTGETFAGTGASGAAGSAQVGAVAGNISRNIFATAARKGNTDINSAQIVTGAITSEALNEAFKYMPGFGDLSKSDQATAVNAFKVAFNKDSNAAYQMFNQGFDATIKGLDEAAKSLGYKDLSQQNAVNNFVQDQGSTEDINALRQYEQKTQDAYNAYAPLKEKNDAWFARNAAYGPLSEYAWALSRDGSPASTSIRGPIIQKANDEWNWLQDPNHWVPSDKFADVTKTYNTVKNETQPYLDNITTLVGQGWDNLAQQKAAAAAGYTTPESYDTYLTDKKAAAKISAQQTVINEQNRLDAETKQKTDDEAERLRLAGLQENTNVDLNKVVAGTDTVAADTGAHTVAGTKGTDTTIGDGTAMGDTTKALAGADAYKYDPAKKTYTYTSDDGSTLTLDENGGIVGSTEATDTSWTGLTDKNTGNLKLPKLPGGLTPTVKPPAKKTTTTTTGTGTTTTGTGTTTTGTGTTTTGTGTTTTGTGTTTTGTGTTTTGTGTKSIDSILNLLEGTGGGGQQVPYTPAQIPVADIKSYYNTIRGISGERLLPESKEKKENYGVDGMFAEGGTVDDLLRILRG
jgi:hypothetical protein